MFLAADITNPLLLHSREIGIDSSTDCKCCSNYDTFPAIKNIDVFTLEILKQYMQMRSEAIA